MSVFDQAFDRLILVEGGYADEKHDRGGKTRYGVTERVARDNGYAGPMDQLPLDEAKRIYKAQYWDTLSLDAVAALSGPIAEELFDTGVNMGTGRAGHFLQRALNALNRGGRDGADLEVDGQIGPATLTSLRTFLAIRGAKGATVLLRALNCLQGSRYIEIAEGDPTQEAFAFGWFNHRVII